MSCNKNQRSSWSQRLHLFLTGLCMGAADAVPGVSGGTIAFVAGIYQELIGSIKSISFGSVDILFKQGIKPFLQAINAPFLVTLGSGVVLSLISFAHIVTYMLLEHPIAIWSFFFGLIIASAVLVGSQIGSRRPHIVAAFFVGGGVAFAITLLTPVQVDPSYPMIFGSGVIAICAMILPGISGAFLLIIMGMYLPVVSALKEFQFDIIVVFVLGCGVGLLSFSRILAWMFDKMYHPTIALLTGFMIGSLNKVWPWKIDLIFATGRHGESIPVVQKNVLPIAFEQMTGQPSQLGMAFICVLAGVALILGLHRIAQFSEPALSK